MLMERARRTADAALGVAGQAIVATAITVLFILSGYAARQGLQSLTMLALSTGLMASRAKADAKTLGYVATATIAAGAGYLAFGLPQGAPLAWPVTLLVGAGSWVLVGAALLARGRGGEGLARRRPEAWAWVVGAATWLGISLTYGDGDLVAAVGRLATYLWVPWASAGFLVTAWLLPRLVERRWPRPLPTATRWAGGMARGVAIGALVAFGVGQVVAQVGPAFSGAGAMLEAPPCATCDPARHLVALQARATPNGTLVAAAFGAPPEGLLLSFEGFDAPFELREDEEGWSVLGNGRAVEQDTLSVARVDRTVLVMLHERALWRPLAVEALEGNRLPAEGHYAPRAMREVETP